MILNTKYTEYAARYKRVRDVVEGEYRLKAFDLSALAASVSDESKLPSTRYLRPLSPNDKTNYNVMRNQGYINGARFFGATARTLSGLMGMLFRADPAWTEFDARMAYLIDNADGGGLSLDQQSQLVAWNTAQIGRHGLLCDMPRANDGKEVTRADVDAGLRPSIQQYTAENIVDYNESIVNGSKVLDLLVLREKRIKFNDNKIDRTVDTVYKVYRLSDLGVSVQMYDGEAGAEATGYGSAIGEEIGVTGGGNVKLERIPFSFVGSINNDPSYDLLPLEPLADTNIGHYQESANLRSTSYQLSAAQLVISDDKYQRAVDGEEESAEVGTGEGEAIILGSDGSAQFISPDPNNISASLMEKDEERMAALGAQLVMSGGQAETAETARIKRASDVSTLENIAINIADAYDKMFMYCHIFMGMDYKYLGKTELNREFYDTKLTAQEIDAQFRLLQGGGISKRAFDLKMQHGKAIHGSIDLEEMNEEIDEEVGVDFDEVTPSGATITTREQ